MSYFSCVVLLFLRKIHTFSSLNRPHCLINKMSIQHGAYLETLTSPFYVWCLFYFAPNQCLTLELLSPVPLSLFCHCSVTALSLVWLRWTSVGVLNPEAPPTETQCPPSSVAGTDCRFLLSIITTFQCFSKLQPVRFVLKIRPQTPGLIKN